MTAPREELVFVGDVHLECGDAELDPFLGYLDRLAERAGRIVLMGDLFNLWIGAPELEQSHHAAVVARLRAIRERGVRVDYVEGNRDYRIGSLHGGTTFDEVASETLELEHAGRRIVAVHGDLANPRDLQYRAWRRLSRSRPLWALFNLIPRRRRLSWAEGVETRMRGTNRRFRQAFPEADVRAYGETFAARGRELVVLGHFHMERRMPLARDAELIVLPEWKEARKALHVSGSGEAALVAG